MASTVQFGVYTTDKTPAKYVPVTLAIYTSFEMWGAPLLIGIVFFCYSFFKGDVILILVSCQVKDWVIFFHSFACFFTELPTDGFSEPSKICVFNVKTIVVFPATIPGLTTVPPSTRCPKQEAWSLFLPHFSPLIRTWDLPTPHLEYFSAAQSGAFFLLDQKRINILLYCVLHLVSLWCTGQR